MNKLAVCGWIGSSYGIIIGIKVGFITSFKSRSVNTA
jgi:hypothetical protein